jgi:Tol biopolymer transport system component
VGSARAVLAPAGTLAYLVDDGQWSDLVTVDRRGGGVRAVPLPDSITVTSAQWSPDGRRIAAELVTSRGGFDVGVVDPATGALARLTSDGQSRNPVWSPDGRTVYYVSARTGAGMIWRQPADGTGTPESLAAVGVGALLSPSRDGRWLAVLDGRALRGYDLVAGALRDVATEAAWAEHLALSPDGRWVAYTTTEGGRRRVVARPFPGGGAPVPLTLEEGGEPVWSADGRTLFYLATREQLRSMSLAAGPALRVTARRDEVSGPWFALSAGSRQHYDVAPDGGRLLGLRRRYQKPRLVVVTHWRQQVEAQLAREGGAP